MSKPPKKYGSALKQKLGAKPPPTRHHLAPRPSQAQPRSGGHDREKSAPKPDLHLILRKLAKHGEEIDSSQAIPEPDKHIHIPYHIYMHVLYPNGYGIIGLPKQRPLY